MGVLFLCMTKFMYIQGLTMRIVKSIVLSALLVCSATGTAFATNGLLLEGYGPVSHAMGGTSMAFDNGAAAMTNNPATLGLAPEGNRIDIAAGLLRPSVRWDMGPGMSERSDAKNFFMPAIGYVRRQGDWAYGIGAYALGGMGTDYPHAGMYSQTTPTPSRSAFSQTTPTRACIPSLWWAKCCCPLLITLPTS